MTRIASSTVLGSVLAGLLFAAPAAAVVTTGTNAGATVTGNGTSTVDYSFTFIGVDPFSPYVTFTTNKKFSVSLVAFPETPQTNPPTGAYQSGFILNRVSPDAEVVANQTSVCSGSPISSGACTFVNSGGFVSQDFLDLKAGTYELGIYEGNNRPPSGTATFRVSEVPVPMAGLMLVSALGLWRAGSRKSA